MSTEVTKGEPRYRVSHIPGRWIFRWAVMCGTGTGPVYVTWRYLQAQRVRSLLEGAWADGVFMAQQQLPEGMRHCTIRFIECEVGHGRLTATNWVDHGCPWCKVGAKDHELEIERNRLAACGVAALGYFTGCADQYKSASLHDVLQLRRETERLRAAQTGLVQESAVRGFLGWLSGTLPELHSVEVPRLAEAWSEYNRMVEAAVRDGAHL